MDNNATMKEVAGEVKAQEGKEETPPKGKSFSDMNDVEMWNYFARLIQELSQRTAT